MIVEYNVEKEITLTFDRDNLAEVLEFLAHAATVLQMPEVTNMDLQEFVNVITEELKRGGEWPESEQPR